MAPGLLSIAVLLSDDQLLCVHSEETPVIFRGTSRLGVTRSFQSEAFTTTVLRNVYRDNSNIRLAYDICLPNSRVK